MTLDLTSLAGTLFTRTGRRWGKCHILALNTNTIITSVFFTPTWPSPTSLYHLLAAGCRTSVLFIKSVWLKQTWPFRKLLHGGVYRMRVSPRIHCEVELCAREYEEYLPLSPLVIVLKKMVFSGARGDGGGFYRYVIRMIVFGVQLRGERSALSLKLYIGRIGVLVCAYFPAFVISCLVCSITGVIRVDPIVDLHSRIVAVK